MECLVKEEKLEIKYQFGKGAWTYYIQVPNTKDVVGRWGTLKVSGFIDDYKIESKNLLSISGQDKLISINEKIRKSIKKSSGDIVLVTLYLIMSRSKITKKDIFEAFQDADVLTVFDKLEDTKKAEIISKVISQKTEEKQTMILVQLINQLSKSY